MKGKKVQGIERCLVAQVMVPCVLACIMFVPYGIDAEIIDRIVAVVNEDIITLSELRDISLPYLERMKSEFSVTYGEEEIKAREGKQYLLVFRNNYKSSVVVIGADEYNIIKAVANNLSLQEIINMTDCDINNILPSLIANKWIVDIK